ncbi:glycoside hydrolase family 16 protein [Aquisediminimonas profunda]|uniref:glycoside hydrolase family 16 protein n=1 Tax=Aquisediminimonas profunda TaxID=1550733 RepID=UPI001C6273F1|nr:glycoside hydrolase family 16 protein [Aquisediminimonas profunda]
MALRHVLITASVALSLPTLACADSMPAHRLDRSGLKLVFDESFDRPPSFWDPDRGVQGRWKTNYFFGEQDADHPKGWTSRTLEPNGELQYYARPGDVPAAFVWKGGVLSLVAQPNSDPADRLRHGLPFVSGLITTEKSFRLDEGYFEARMAFPQGKGLWPAFWLLPAPALEAGKPTNPGGQEIDIVESIGEPGRIYQTVFTDTDGTKVKNDRAFETHADLGQFHVYGVLVTKSDIIWYFDDVEVRRVANIDFHRPAYLLLNLAVGGDWPGAPDAGTKFPAAMRIDWVRAYRVKGSAS